jgi:hypothetical protein
MTTVALRSLGPNDERWPLLANEMHLDVAVWLLGEVIAIVK